MLTIKRTDAAGLMESIVAPAIPGTDRGKKKLFFSSNGKQQIIVAFL